jgi:hypothetical protein
MLRLGKRKQNCTLGDLDSSSGIFLVVTKVLHGGSWFVGSWLLPGITFEGGDPGTESQELASIDVVRKAPYNERNQLFGEFRWTLNRPATCLKPAFP